MILVGRHEGYFKSVADQTVNVPNSNAVLSFSKDELINIEYSHKVGYSSSLNKIYPNYASAPVL